MAYTNMNFTPAEQAESEPYGIDFIYDLLESTIPNEQLAQVVTFSIGVLAGVDATPAVHLMGSPYVSVNPQTPNSGLATVAVQQISGLLPNVQYWIGALCLTTAGRTISLWSQIPPGNPPIFP